MLLQTQILWDCSHLYFIVSRSDHHSKTLFLLYFFFRHFSTASSSTQASLYLSTSACWTRSSSSKISSPSTQSSTTHLYGSGNLFVITWQQRLGWEINVFWSLWACTVKKPFYSCWYDPFKYHSTWLWVEPLIKERTCPGLIRLSREFLSSSFLARTIVVGCCHT